MKRLFPLILAFLSFLTPAFARNYTPTECRVVGNTNSRIYHTPGGRSYAKMLRENQKGDNQECFKTEAAARAAGYRHSKR